ncbi:MAG TPA: peptidoglycan recognition family protein [Kofleriaceae bacterium]|nr:peptidoglycan recognition family protein [Kofleriaceae bacterium]
MPASAPWPPVPRNTSPPIHSRWLDRAAGRALRLALGAALLAHAAAAISARTAHADDRVPDDRVPDEPAIVDKPIPFDDERVRLTLAYRRQHVDPDAADITIEPRVIVLHYTAGGTAEGTFQYFSGNHMEAARAALAAAGDVNVSSHFLVDRDGTIYRLMPETRMARHCIGLNHVAIGVENVGDDKKWPLTDAQVEADARLVRYLAARFPITHLVGHSEAARLEGKIYFHERDPKYRNVKPDPGTRFMKLVRARLADLKLKGPP